MNFNQSVLGKSYLEKLLFDTLAHRSTMASMKIFLCLMFLLSACKTPDVEDVNPIDRYLTPDSKDYNEMRSDYFTLMNSFRQSNGERALLHSDILEKEAQLHAQNIARGVVPFGHTGNIQRCSDIRSDHHVLSTNLCSEIIASGPDSGEEALSVWGFSSSAKEKILNPSYTYTGIGIQENSEGKTIWVQIFLEGE